jgi:hypothetical protein
MSHCLNSPLFSLLNSICQPGICREKAEKE